MECVENRYMFDTSALDALCKSSGTDELKIYASKGKGFEYYFTETQLEESEKNINSKEYAGLDVVSRAAAMRAIKMLKLVSKIQNRWLLDGTFELLPSGEEKAFEMYQEILNNNPWQHYNDAIIALTGIVNGCTIVVNDTRFRNTVNRNFPGRAITYSEFLSRL